MRDAILTLSGVRNAHAKKKYTATMLRCTSMRSSRAVLLRCDPYEHVCFDVCVKLHGNLVDSQRFEGLA